MIDIEMESIFFDYLENWHYEQGFGACYVILFKSAKILMNS